MEELQEGAKLDAIKGHLKRNWKKYAGAAALAGAAYGAKKGSDYVAGMNAKIAGNTKTGVANIKTGKALKVTTDRNTAKANELATVTGKHEIALIKNKKTLHRVANTNSNQDKKLTELENKKNSYETFKDDVSSAVNDGVKAVSNAADNYKTSGDMDKDIKASKTALKTIGHKLDDVTTFNGNSLTDGKTYSKAADQVKSTVVDWYKTIRNTHPIPYERAHRKL